MWARIVIALLALMFSFDAQAGGKCYSPEEVQAEQMLRLHSELMVITVTCRQSSAGRDLPGAYTKFTKDNIAQLHEAEATLERYYKRNYGGSGVDRLDKLRTKLANEYGQQIANISAPLFCAQRRDKVTAMCDSKPIAISTEVGRMCGAVQTLEPPCLNAQKAATVAPAVIAPTPTGAQSNALAGAVKKP